MDSTSPRSLRFTPLIAAMIFMFTVALGPSQAGAATFSNPESITINDAATATPYPSTIPVAGVDASAVDVNVTLSGFTHTFPADVDVLLVSPGGQSVVLMSDVPRDDPVCGSDAVGLILTFDDAAAGPIPLDSALTSGTYQPTNNNTYVTNCAPGPDVDAFPGPAPTSPYGSTLAAYNETNPNGTWSLYVLDDGGGDSGSIENGWSLDITASSCEEEGQPSLQVGLALAEGCFTERKDAEEHGTGVFETSEEAWVGGFDLKPNPGGVLVIEPSNHEDPLRAEGSGVNLLLRHLSVPAPLSELKPFVGSYTLGVNTVGSVERFVKLPLLSGQVTVKWDPGGAGATLEGGVSLEELSKGLGSLEAGGVGTSAGKLTLKLANNAPADVTGGELQLPEFTVELKGTNPKLKAGFGGGKFNAQEVGGAVEWSGEVSAFFPFEERQGSIIGRLFLRETSLSGAGFALSGIQVPVAKTGWSLTGVNGNLVLTPELGFDLGIEAVKPLSPARKGAGPPLFKLTGNVKGLKLATDCKNGSNPFEFLGTTNAPELEARKIGTLKAQVLMCAYVPDARDFAFEAGLSGLLTVDLGPAKKIISAKGSASGWFHDVDFNLEGDYQLTLPVFGVLGAQGLLSSEGYAFCGQYDFISAGVATHNWLEAPEDIVGCDFTPYRAAKTSSATLSSAHPTHAVLLRRGERVVSLAVRGAKGAPRIRLRGPHGERFASPKRAKPLKGKAVIIVPEPGLDTTYVYLKHPSAGPWRIQSAGGAPIRRIDTAHKLPEPKVSATISAKGAQQVLSWKARAIPGQKVALIDRTDGVATTLQGFTPRQSGELRFTPENATAAPRTIEADILQNGIPRARLTVARYRLTGSKQRAPRIGISGASCRDRTCRAKLRLPSGTRRVRLELRRGTHTIATSTHRAKAGTRTITLPLHHTLGPGAYTLRVRAILSGSRTTTASKAIHVRHGRARHRRRLGRASAEALAVLPFPSD